MGLCASLAQAQLLESLLYGPENVEEAEKKKIDELTVRGDYLSASRSTGELLERTPVSYPELSVKGGEEFSHGSMIRVRPDCADFEIVWDEVRSGELIYTVSGGRAVARYDRIDPALDNIDSAEASRVPPTPKRHKHLMRLFALIAIVAIIAGNIFYLIGEISEENERRREHSSGTMNQGFYLK